VSGLFRGGTVFDTQLETTIEKGLKIDAAMIPRLVLSVSDPMD